MNTTSKIKDKTNLFGTLVNWFSKGNKDKEIFWWDIFYRYEVAIGICVGAIIALLFSLLIYPIFCSEVMTASSKTELSWGNGLLVTLTLTLIYGITSSLLLSWVMVLPFYERARNDVFPTHKRLDIGPARVVCTNIFSAGGIIILIYAIVRVIYKNVLISKVQGIIIAIAMILLLLIVAINAVSYCNWRFDWAIDNQDSIYSRHYKYWTSSSEFASERYQWKHLRWYKMMVAIVLLAGPSILGTTFFLYTASNKSKHDHNTQQEIQSSVTEENAVTSMLSPQNTSCHIFELCQADIASLAVARTSAPTPIN